jgi:hypothetical protein
MHRHGVKCPKLAVSPADDRHGFSKKHLGEVLDAFRLHSHGPHLFLKTSYNLRKSKMRTWGYIGMTIVCTAMVILSVFVIAILLMRYKAPWPWIANGVDAEAANATAAVKLLEEGRPDGRPLYISFDRTDPSAESMEFVRLQLPNLRIAPISLRPRSDKSSGQPATRNDDVFDHDIVKMGVFSMPLWRTAMVSGTLDHCHYELILFKGLSSWQVISWRDLCAD